MYKLILIRHAKTMRDAFVRTDMLRHLTERGYDDAFKTAEWCMEQKIIPDAIVTSPAIRAFSTAAIIANCYGYPTDQILLNSSVYDAAADTLLYVVNEFNNNHKTVMLFGHNPGFTDVVNLLCGPVITHLPTAAVAVLHLDVKSWADVKKGSAKLQQVFSSHKEFE